MPERLADMVGNAAHISIAIVQGDVKAIDRLLHLVCEELGLLVTQRPSHERLGQMLQIAALANGASARLVGSSGSGWQSRRHFFAALAEAMRRIPSDRPGPRNSQRRCGDYERVAFDSPEISGSGPLEDLVKLGKALAVLTERNPETTEIVRFHRFGSSTSERAAEGWGLSRGNASSLGRSQGR